MTVASVKRQILATALIPMKGSNIGISQQPMDKSQFRQQQSIRRGIISRIAMSWFMECGEGTMVKKPFFKAMMSKTETTPWEKGILKSILEGSGRCDKINVKVHSIFDPEYTFEW